MIHFHRESLSRWQIVLFYWLPALGWLLLVALFSSRWFGAGQSGLWLVKILHWLHLRVAGAEFQILHYTIRKTAHFAAYATLSGLLFRALRASEQLVAPWRPRWMVVSLGLCLLTASSDEIHQAFTPGRTGTWRDVALDMIGALFVQMLILATERYVRVPRAVRPRPVPTPPTP